MFDLGAVREHVRTVLFAFPPPMLEKPLFGKLARVGQSLDGQTANVVNGFVKLRDLSL